MKTLNAYLVIAAAATALGAASPASATIRLNDVLEIDYYDSNQSLTMPVETDTVQFLGPGTTLFAYSIYATFDPNRVTLEQAAYGYTSGDFVGFVISDTTHPSALARWTVQPGGAPTPVNSGEIGDLLYVNWQGVANAVGDQLVFSAPGPVPGPGLAGLAALALAGLHARKRRA